MGEGKKANNQTKKVAILGFAPHYDKAPFNDESFEIWGLNDLYQFIPRWTRWFDIHDREIHKIDETYVTRADGSSHIDGLKGLNCPVYMVKHYDDIPNSVAFPIEAACEYFNTRYFTNTISMMIALAVMEGFTEIHIYGVDMSVGVEYQEQRSSCEYFIGYARGMGIKVYLPPESDLLQTAFLYGFEEQEKNAYVAKLDELIRGMEKRRADAQRIINDQTTVMNQYDGAIHGFKDLKRVRLL